ncbi:MAG: hypothetical protein ABFD90_12560 [Phycisphaerales bacterium]
MAGIAGIVGWRSRTEGAALLDAMLHVMMYEPFYTRASHVDAENGWYVGGASIRGGFADCLPVRNETGDVLLFLSGECFLDSTIVDGLRCRGHRFDPSHASVLVHLYEERGPQFLRELNGWFSGLLLDVGRRRAMLFNDRYAMQKVYYHETPDGVCFASEAKALLKAIPSLRAIDARSVADYLCFDCVLDERTFFPEVHVLAPGSLWIFEGNHVEKTRYFDPAEYEAQEPLAAGPFLEELGATFKRVLPRYLRGEKLSLALTAGLDTRLILACLPQNDSRVEAVTFAGSYRDSIDVRMARKLSERSGIPHHTIRLDGDFLAEYPDHAARAMYVSDGLADATTVDCLYLERRVRGISTVKLMGGFGSQVLGRVKPALRARPPVAEVIHPDFRPQMSVASEGADAGASCHPLSRMLRREIPWYWSKFTVPQMSQVMVRSPFLDNDLIRALYRAPREGYDGTTFELQAVKKYNEPLMAVRTNKGVGGSAPPVIDGLVRNVIRFRRLADRTLNWEILPHSMHHMVTRMDCRLLSPLHLDGLFLGYECYQHYNRWFRRELSPCVREILLDRTTLQRPYWDPAQLRKIVENHIEGRGRYLREIRKALTIELIHRVLVENWRST